MPDKKERAWADVLFQGKSMHRGRSLVHHLVKTAAQAETTDLAVLRAAQLGR